MKLYHFCAPQFLEGIQQRGLTLGRTPFYEEGGKTAFLARTQWMTVNPEFKQAWNGMVALRYDRTAFRLTFVIPKSAQKHILTWPELKNRLIRNFGEGCILRDFESGQDTENWRIFVGRVKPGWLRRVVAKIDADAEAE
jgi:hypothetical protein